MIFESKLSDRFFASNPRMLLINMLIVLIFVVGAIAISTVFIFPLLPLTHTETYPITYPMPVEQPVEIESAPPQIEVMSAHTIELTRGGRKRIGGLIGLKDMTAAEAIRQRGGGQSQVKQLQTGYELKTVGELANLAAEGNIEAKRAIKIIKEADKKAQKYGGK
ncbi:hypothetical protein QUF64_05260 [Anaerolineales bacterium HSG6]|nr:hypothetical protein [Anaerolineales bacterium HSG6]